MRPQAAFLLLAALPAIAQPADDAGPELRLTLAEARAIALERNVDLRVERETAATSEAGEVRARGAWDPLVRVDARLRERTDPVNSILSGAPSGELAPTQRSAGLSLGVVQLLPTGGSLTLTSTLAREKTDSVFSILSPSWTSSLGLEIRQPLLRNRATDVARTALRVARVDRGRSAASLQRVAADTVAALERSYWTLVAARQSVEARTSAVALAVRQQEDVSARVEAGTLSESDLASPLAEVERRKGELLASREAAARAENALKSLLLGDPADPAWASRVVPADDAEPAAAPAAPTAPDVAAAEGRRPEVAEAAARLDRLTIEAEAARDRVRPQLDLVAGYIGRGLAGDPNPGVAPPFPSGPVEVPEALDGGLGRSLGTIGEGRFPDASVGLAFALPLGNRAARAESRQLRSARVQAELALLRARQQVGVEVRNAAFAEETAAQRVAAVRAARLAAETQLRAEEERFAAGLTTSFFVLTRQNDLTQARLVETQALADLRMARVERARAEGTLLSDRRIQLHASEPAAAPERGTR
ncbi:MAG TPA: TolC family protein [Thermoanaerobaculia bacterium]|nr:TolC family protein [Thermoanaerobaculia bacterium]HQN07298.1 TolC family protein [Thermoanaerobaculia bacterium]HQP86577.1 TolC family protein [Thermoanaerobaculia bacterium]